MCVVCPLVIATKKSSRSVVVPDKLTDTCFVLSRMHRRDVRDMLAPEFSRLTGTVLYDISAASRLPHRQY